MLDLDSPEWASITASPRGNGVLTAQLLKQLWAGDESAWAELYQQVCHQNSVGEVAYVAVPHLVAISRNSSQIGLKALLLNTVGVIVASSQCYHLNLPEIRDDWNGEFLQACDDAREQAADLLRKADVGRDESLLLIGAVAAFHGHANLTMLLQDGPDFWCPECGEYIDFRERIE